MSKYITFDTNTKEWHIVPYDRDHMFSEYVYKDHSTDRSAHFCVCDVLYINWNEYRIVLHQDTKHSNPSKRTGIRIFKKYLKKTIRPKVRKLITRY